MLAGLAFERRAGRRHMADFRYSQGALRDDEVFDSALAVPGRYLAEIGRRLFFRHPDADFLMIGNPLLPLRANLLSGWFGHAPESAEIGADADGFPLYYCLPRRCFDEYERFLLLLSVQDAELDANLLEAVLGENVARRILPIGPVGPPPAHGPNGWLNGDLRLDALKRQAERSLALIQKRKDWRDIPFAVYYPMHAGDVLFMAMASSMVQATPFTRQVVCQAYADIPDACGSRLETIKLKLPWISRDGSVSEARYFAAALDRLGREADESFFVFSRILRLYYRTPFHLVDHARFALGHSMLDFSQTLHFAPLITNKCAARPKPLKVLFHLNGGWKLKTYPVQSMRAVIRTLRGMGIEVGVIDRPDLAADGAFSYVSEDSTTLRRLVSSHHLFVGVDSFPHHFSRLRLGWPTIGLFGNTKPTNSDAAYGADYQTSEMNMACNRCGAYDQCPVLGTDQCANYAPAERVVGDILAMAGRLYDFRPH